MEMLKEGGQLSFTRVLIASGYIMFLLVSLYLAVFGKHWDNYSAFALATGGSIVVQFGNKFVNSKYNTPLGEVGKQGGKEQ